MTKASDNAFPSILVTEQAAKPAAPAAGKQRLYMKTDHKLYHVDSEGTETEVGGGGTPTNLYVGVKIHDEVLASDGTFDVSSIAADYDYLDIIAELRSDVAAESDDCRLRFNNDTTDGNYYWTGMRTAQAGSNTYSGNLPYLGAVCGNSSPAGYFANRRASIARYAGTSCHKVALVRGNERRNATLMYSWEAALHWESTAAINRVTITPVNGTNFKAGSSLLIIGYKQVSLLVSA